MDNTYFADEVFSRKIIMSKQAKQLKIWPNLRRLVLKALLLNTYIIKGFNKQRNHMFIKCMNNLKLL